MAFVFNGNHYTVLDLVPDGLHLLIMRFTWSLIILMAKIELHAALFLPSNVTEQLIEALTCEESLLGFLKIGTHIGADIVLSLYTEGVKRGSRSYIGGR